MAIDTFRRLHEIIVQDALNRTQQATAQRTGETAPLPRPALSGGTYTDTGYVEFWRVGDAIGADKPLKP